MKYGRVDVEKFQILKRTMPRLRTFLDGTDITDKCRWADDETGTAEVLVLRESKPIPNITWTDVVTDLVYGRIEFKEPPEEHDYGKDLTDFRKWLS
jgi:hypothetical protein